MQAGNVMIELTHTEANELLRLLRSCKVNCPHLGKDCGRFIEIVENEMIGEYVAIKPKKKESEDDE